MSPLTDLDPRWVEHDGRDGLGVSFRCPGCSIDHRIAVFFANPLDDGDQLPGMLGWQRIGDTFETLTLTPSIRIYDHGSPDAAPVAGREHWHGFITKGMVTT